MICRLIFASFLVAALARCVVAQFPTIELTVLSQPAVQVGARSEIQISGARVDELDQLVFSNPGISAVQRMNDPPQLSDEPVPSGRFDVTVSENVVPGLFDVRARGRFGISNPRALLVTHKPIVRATNDHTDAIQALEINSDSIYVGQAQPKLRHFFRVTLRAGERLQAVAYAAQIDSRMVPSLVLFDDHQRELARSRGLRQWPAEIDFQAQVSGDYVLAIHDFLFLGGAEYPFLLECAVIAGAEAPELELNQLLRPRIDFATDLRRFSNVARANDLQLFAEQPSLSAPEASKTEAAASKDSQTLVAPFTVKGDLAHGTVSYDFQAKQGQPLWLEVKSSQLDQLTDPRLILYRVTRDPATGQEQLNQLADQDDASSIGGPEMRLRLQDASLPWTAPEDGTYRLRLHDQESGRRPADSLAFQLEVRDPTPGFTLLAHHQFPNLNRGLARHFGSNLMRGGTEAILVTALRKDGFDGSIEVAIDELPAGVSCEPAIIPAGASETALIVKAAEDAPRSHQLLRIVGKAEIAGKTVQVAALTGTVEWGSSPTYNSIISRLCAELHLNVNEFDTAPLLVTLGDGMTLEAVPGASLNIPIKVQRREGGQVACLLRAQHLPPKTSLGDVRIEADKNEATAELKLNNDVKPGEYTIWLQNEATVKWSANPQALARAEAYLEKLKKALEASEAAAEKAALTAVVENQTKVVENLKKQTAVQDVATWMPSTSVRIRVSPAATENPK